MESGQEGWHWYRFDLAVRYKVEKEGEKERRREGDSIINDLLYPGCYSL